MRTLRFTLMGINQYLVFAFDNGLKQALFRAIEGQAAAEQDKEDDSTAPHVHWLSIRLSLHHLRSHEVRCAHSAYKTHIIIRSLTTLIGTSVYLFIDAIILSANDVATMYNIYIFLLLSCISSGLVSVYLKHGRAVFKAALGTFKPLATHLDGFQFLLLRKCQQMS